MELQRIPTATISKQRNCVSNILNLTTSAVSNFPESRERRLKLLEERKCRYEELKHCEFTADEGLIGLIIGKQGEKLTRVAREHKVEIRVLPDDEGVRRVKIYGTDVTSVQRARSLLEYIYSEYFMSEDMIEWILCKKGGSIKEVSQKAGLHSAWFDDANRIILLCGLRHAVEEATQLLNNHAQLFQLHSSAALSGGGYVSPPPPPQIGVDSEDFESKLDRKHRANVTYHKRHPNTSDCLMSCADGSFRHLL